MLRRPRKGCCLTHGAAMAAETLRVRARWSEGGLVGCFPRKQSVRLIASWQRPKARIIPTTCPRGLGYLQAGFHQLHRSRRRCKAGAPSCWLRPTLKILKCYLRSAKFFGAINGLAVAALDEVQMLQRRGCNDGPEALPGPLADFPADLSCSRAGLPCFSTRTQRGGVGCWPLRPCNRWNCSISRSACWP